MTIYAFLKIFSILTILAFASTSTSTESEAQIFQISKENQNGVLRIINENREKLARGQILIETDPMGGSFAMPAAANMMEVAWSDAASKIAEKELIKMCKSDTFSIKKGSFKLSDYEISENGTIFDDSAFFDFTTLASLSLLTKEFRSSDDYTARNSWQRLLVLTMKAELTEVGCSVARRCGGEGGKLKVVCAHGKSLFKYCKTSCQLYKKGEVCSKCPKGSKCTSQKLCGMEKKLKSGEGKNRKYWFLVERNGEMEMEENQMGGEEVPQRKVAGLKNVALAVIVVVLMFFMPINF